MMGLVRRLNPIDVLGPIFTNELTRASRKRRNYFLRSVYVLAMLAVMGFSWAANMPSDSNIEIISGMSRFGRNMVLSIGMFQFVALQLIAPAITGSSISEEIRKQTLLSLLMTPVSSFQIIMGKLLSRMTLLFLLVATSFPVLAILRIYGGVEWNLVVAMETLTLCAALFAAGLSLMFSTYLKRNIHDPAAMAILVLLGLYLFVPGILTAIHEWQDWAGRSEIYWSYFNPFTSMMMVAGNVTQFRSTPAAYTWSSPIVQCGLLIGATFIVILLATIQVRKSAICQASGETKIPTKGIKKDRLITGVGAESSPNEGEVTIEPPKSRLLAWSVDRPVLWKDLRTAPWMIKAIRRPVLHESVGMIVLMVAIGLPLWMAIYPLEQETRSGISMIIIQVCTGMMLLQATSNSAAVFSKEREANTLELLLTTPLSPREIVWDKVRFGLIGLISWAIILPILLIMFMGVGFVSPAGALGVLVSIAGPVFFIVCAGVFFSLRSKDTRTSTVKNYLLAFSLWVPCCPVVSLLSAVFMPINPFYNVYCSMTSFEHSTGQFIRHIFDMSPYLDALILPGGLLLYGLLGWGLVRYAISTFYKSTLNFRRSAIGLKGWKIDVTRDESAS